MNLDLPLQPKQTALLHAVENSLYTRIGFGGSRGAAKSHGGRSVMLTRRFNHPGTNGLIFRRKRKQLIKNHIEPLQRQFSRLMEHGYYADPSNWRLELPTNPVSKIFFGCAENAGDIDDFQGDEYMDVMVDEASHLAEREHKKLEATCRWTAKAGIKCCVIDLMNPGGPGHAYIQRLYITKQYHENEIPKRYHFLQAYAWDNVEWSRDALNELGYQDECNLTQGCRCASCVYYSWDNKTRFKFFVAKTQYGMELNALPESLRPGWLLGNWDKFAGQYYDIFDVSRHVKECRDFEKTWHSRWMGIDWGFKHDFAAGWFARDGKVTRLYKEFVDCGLTPRALAQTIVDKTPEADRKLIEQIYLSPDAWANRTGQDTIVDQMGGVFRMNGMPYPTVAEDDRADGWALIYSGFESDELIIDPSCKKTIECIPKLSRDEDEPEAEDCIKFEGDDPADMLRYGLMSRHKPNREPAAERQARLVQEHAEKQGHRNLEEMDPTELAMLARRVHTASQRRTPGFKRWYPGQRRGR